MFCRFNQLLFHINVEISKKNAEMLSHYEKRGVTLKHYNTEISFEMHEHLR